MIHLSQQRFCATRKMNTSIKTLLALVVAVPLTVGCQKQQPAETVPSDLLDDIGRSPLERRRRSKPKPPKQKPKPVDATQTPAEAALSEDDVKKPVAGDLAEYIADLTGSGLLYATFFTSEGGIRCELFEHKTPMTVANFVGLARGLKAFKDPVTGKAMKRPFYDGLIFHRVIPGFMIQGGDPIGRGSGGPGYRFDNEVDDSLTHETGTLSMANAGPDTNGSQFFIMDDKQERLDGKYSIFGRCEDEDIVRNIARVASTQTRPDTDVIIQRVTISRGKP